MPDKTKPKAVVPQQIHEYRIINKIGRGSFGDVFEAVNENNKQRVALKLEENDVERPHLLNEFQMYKRMKPSDGIPRVHNYYTEPNYNVMVMELLGPSLEDLFKFCSRRFSLKTVLMLACQMIRRMADVHENGVMHRDVKPENFVMGMECHQKLLYIIDFGLAKRFDDTNRNILKWTNRMAGTARYASVNALKGFQVSRRDDMESLGYVMIYFLRGRLPWQGLSGPSRKQKIEKIAEMKQSIETEELCKGFPIEFGAYLDHCRRLDYDKEPNYPVLECLFSDLFKRLKYVDDGVYDWKTLKMLKDKPQVYKSRHDKDVNEENKQKAKRSRN